MQMQGERTIRASRAVVWRALNDPEVLKVCVPGCDSIEKISGSNFEASVIEKIGPVKARFLCTVELTDVVREVSYTIRGEGKGGAAGFAKGSAKVQLEDIPRGTRLTYETEAKVGGKLAQLGGRLIDSFARKTADEFFARLQHAVERPEEPAAGAAEPGEPKVGWFRRLIDWLKRLLFG